MRHEGWRVYPATPLLASDVLLLKILLTGTGCSGIQANDIGSGLIRQIETFALDHRQVMDIVTQRCTALVSEHRILGLHGIGLGDITWLIGGVLVSPSATHPGTKNPGR